ncbi:hypothetical protein GCM10022292_33920 [Winogradskyella damuponensis]|uniref:Uncharacterized protein n=1 Tax=Winogradskyella damuponensis TaxID=943939 RepID=A0ABP8D4I5_9FLAO
MVGMVTTIHGCGMLVLAMVTMVGNVLGDTGIIIGVGIAIGLMVMATTLLGTTITVMLTATVITIGVGIIITTETPIDMLTATLEEDHYFIIIT